MEPINLQKTADELDAQDVFIHNLTAERDRLRAALALAAEQIRKCDYTPAQSTLLEALKGQP